LTSLKFGREYLIPKPLDPRVLLWEAPAVAQAAMESKVARKEIDIKAYRELLIARQGHGQQLRNSIVTRAKIGAKKRVVYGEGDQAQIIRAAYQVKDEGIAEPILLGSEQSIMEQIADLGLDFEPTIINPRKTDNEVYIDEYRKLRDRRGVTQARAITMMRSRTHYGLMMVKMGAADAFVSGIVHEYPDIIRPALQLFHTQPGTRRASGIYLMIVKGKVYIFTDATVNIDPDAETLAEIAILAADFTMTMNIEPVVAMLSFSNFGSTPHPLSVKVRDAVKIVEERRPDIPIDGEMQADTAVVEAIIEDRYPSSKIKNANVLVFPDLGSANIAYKLLDRLTDVEAIGPILLGVGAPVQVLQAGDEVQDIVAMTAVAVLDAQLRD
jgi:malate dehydrogenase (oxaloacetate-decarboxylating)(NADP+)